jgi:zearalenone synthase (highly reducing iterative type I polyketide synthase)
VRGIKGNHYTRPPSQANGVITINDTNGMNGHGRTNGVNWWNESPKVNGVSPTITSRNGPRLFVVSAQDKEGLKRVKLRLAGFLDKKPEDIKDGSEKGEAFLADLAYSLSARRSALQWKTYGIASSLEELSQVLRDDQATAMVKRSSRNPRIGFVFTGQGAQWPRMGAELMEYKIFRESIQAADKYLREECECTWSAAEELQKNKSTSQLHLAAYSQTLCTVLQVALVELLKTWNILPVAVAGHSSGEISAAYCMGAITKEDAWKIAFWRGILSSGMKDTDPDVEGTMIAVGASPKVAQMWISKVSSGEVVVACINSPSSVTLSGDTTGIDELAGLLKEEGIFARKLQVDTAYHSPHMQMVASDYFEAIADVETLTPAGDCKMHSSVTGFAIEASELGPANWVRNLTSPVQFASAIHDMLRPMQNGVRATENAVDLLVEIGPHSALQGPATQTLKAHGITNIPYQSAIIRNQGAITSALELAGALFAQGFPVDVRHANNDVGTMASYAPKPLVDLPAYPWNHSQKYWAESRIGKEYRLREKPQMSLLGAPSSTTAAGECVWRKFIRLSEEPWVSDHKIQGSILYPAAGFLAMAIEAGAQTADSTRIVASFKLRDIQLTAAAVITDQDDLEFTLQLRPHMTGTRDKGSAWTEFMVSSSADGANLQKNCSGLLIIEYESEAGSETRREKDLEDIESKRLCLEATQQCVTHVSPAKFYADIAALGLIYGPAFANLTQIQSKDKQAFGAVQIPDIPIQVNERIQDRPHIIHPGTLDAIFHLAFAAAKGGKDQLHSAMVPRSIDEVVISANISYKPGTRLTGFSNAAKHGFKELQANIVMLDEQKNFPVVRIAGFCCNEVGGGNSASAEQTAAKNICSKLTWKPAIELLSAEEQKTWIESVEEIVLNDNLKNTIEEEDASALKCIDQVVRAISEDEVTPTQKELFTWMKSKPVKLFSSNKLDIQSTALIQQLKSHLLGEINEHELSNDEDVLHRLFLETQSTTAVLSKLSAVGSRDI